jgi:hypothetical protein
MNILGEIVTEASASVTRAPQNLWMDEATDPANPDTEATASTERKV